uniref:Lysosome-associated membrane glycoprotein 2-like transmembrane domain-containing protein n=1 Tax=Wuchereria bancrofti TaxID=6293 RepID=A0AAF5Q6X7_WUCBA
MASMFFLALFVVYVPIFACDHYCVKDTDNTSCIILDSDITGVLRYMKSDNSTEQFKFNISGRGDGSFCRDVSIKKKTVVHFKQKDDSFLINNFTLAAYFEQELNATESLHMYLMDKHAKLDVSASSNGAYKCSEIILSFEGDSAVTLHNLDVRTSDLVPIVVGVCLAALVITVLTAYLVGRARAKCQGYASV